MSSLVEYGIVVVLVIAILGGLYAHIYGQGEAAANAVVVKTTTAVQGKIDAAQAAGPKSPADVTKLLRSGGF